MDEHDVIEIVYNHIKTNYPQECRNCGRKFASLADYLKNTTHTGFPVSYDAVIGNWKLSKQVGTVSMANCSCGSTLSVSSKNMKLNDVRKLLNWARGETEKQGKKLEILLDEIRNKIDVKVFSEESIDFNIHQQ